MTIETRAVEYRDGDTVLEGMLAYDAGSPTPSPGVIICHPWGGRTEAECDHARQLAELGYTGFALDVYGKGVQGETRLECAELMRPFVEDLPALHLRLLAGVQAVREQKEVDAGRIAVVGYCFGGLCALELARMGAELTRAGAEIAGVVSVHGLLEPRNNVLSSQIKSRVLILHGWEDPMSPPEELMAIAREMTVAEVDWQLHTYGGAMHAFTDVHADDPEFGTRYNAAASRRSWQALTNFLAELFAH